MHLCAKHPCIKTSVCKLLVKKPLCVKAPACKSLSVHKPLCVRVSAHKSCSVQRFLCVTSSVCRSVSVQNKSPQKKTQKTMKQKNQTQMLAVVALIAMSAVTPAVFSQSRSSQKSSNRAVFAHTVNTGVFLRLRSPKPRYLRCFLPLVAKTTVSIYFFGQHLAKTPVFTQFSACCKN